MATLEIVHRAILPALLPAIIGRTDLREKFATKPHVPPDLGEFEYRFNRRYDLANMIPRLAVIATETAPMPYHLHKLADFQA